jgi:hypothetical protein
VDELVEGLVEVLRQAEPALGLERGEAVRDRAQAPGRVDGRRVGEAVAAQRGDDDLEQLAPGVPRS